MIVAMYNCTNPEGGAFLRFYPDTPDASQAIELATDLEDYNYVTGIKLWVIDDLADGEPEEIVLRTK